MKTKTFAGLIVLVLSLVALTGWSCGQGYGVSNVEPTDANEAPETPDITAVWQTYRDETYGVEFKYPERWIYWENREETGTLRNLSFDAEGAEYSNTIDFTISDIVTPIDEEVRELEAQGFNVVESSTVTVSDVQWDRLIIQQRETPLQFIDYNTERGGKSFTFSSGYAGGSVGGGFNQRNIDALHGILDSFQFAE
jgi:hypothetical protein